MSDGHDTYSGLDTTGEVWRLLSNVIAALDSGNATHAHLDMCRQALGKEDDPNWKGFAAGLQGLLLHRFGDIEEARVSLEEAINVTCPYTENFDDVVNVYCQACYTLGSILFDDETQTRPAILCFLRCLPYMNDVYSDVFIGNIFGFLDVLYSREDCDDESLVFAESALYYSGLENGTLESLMFSYANVGRMDRAREVYRALRARASDPDVVARIDDFASRRL